MVPADRPVLRFPDATNSTVPLHPRQDYPFRNARWSKNTEHLLVSELQVQRVQAERLVLQEYESCLIFSAYVGVLRIRPSEHLATIPDRQKENVDLDGEAYPVRIAVVVAGKIHTYRYFRVRPNQEVPVPESVVV